jgi:hypothetical protein
MSHHAKYTHDKTPINIITGICDNPQYAVAIPPENLCPCCKTDGLPNASPTLLGVNNDGVMPFKTPTNDTPKLTFSTGESEIRHLTASKSQLGATNSNAKTNGNHLTCILSVVSSPNCSKWSLVNR